MIDVRVDDLASVAGDAIAWPVDANLRATTALLRRLEEAGGPALAAQLTASEPLPVGSAVVTGAGDLGVELLISAVIASEEDPVTPDGVRRALTSALHRAEAWRIARLVVAPFGLGSGNLAVEDSAAITVDVLAKHLVSGLCPTSVTIVAESEPEAEAFRALLARVAS